MYWNAHPSNCVVGDAVKGDVWQEERKREPPISNQQKRMLTYNSTAMLNDRQKEGAATDDAGCPLSNV